MNSPHKGQWRGALVFSLICVWINDWINSREAGDLRRYRAHYDVIVMRRLDLRTTNIECRPNTSIYMHIIHPQFSVTRPRLNKYDADYPVPSYSNMFFLKTAVCSSRLFVSLSYHRLPSSSTAVESAGCLTFPYGVYHLGHETMICAVCISIFLSRRGLSPWSK